MKKILLIILTVALFPVVELYAQTIKGIPYQTVVRDEQGNPVADQELTVRFYIQRELPSHSDAQPLLYSETHTATSDANGLVRLQVGEGTPVEGSFDAVDWWGKVSIKTEIELAGSGEAVFTSTQELGTVPYALSAESALLLKSDDGTQWSLECDNDGTLKAVAIPERFTKLVFSDEFNGTGLLDDSKWGYEEGYVRNGEEQYYTVAREENAYMADGCLHIVCRNDSSVLENALYEKPWSAGGSHGYRADTIIPITSASVITKGKFAFTYGRVEVRAKLPVCLGSWPAIWMFPQDRSDWPARSTSSSMWDTTPTISTSRLTAPTTIVTTSPTAMPTALPSRTPRIGMSMPLSGTPIGCFGSSTGNCKPPSCAEEPIPIPTGPIPWTSICCSISVSVEAGAAVRALTRTLFPWSM